MGHLKIISYLFFHKELSSLASHSLVYPFQDLHPHEKLALLHKTSIVSEYLLVVPTFGLRVGATWLSLGHKRGWLNQGVLLYSCKCGPIQLK